MSDLDPETRERLRAALHGPTDLASIFGGYMCRCGAPWLTDDCAREPEHDREQLDALALVVAAEIEKAVDECNDERNRSVIAAEKRGAARVRKAVEAVVNRWPVGDNGQDYRAAVTQCAAAVRTALGRGDKE